MIFTPEKLREIRKAFTISIVVIFITLTFYCLFFLREDLQQEMSILFIAYAAILAIMAVFGVPFISLAAPLFGIPIYILCFAYLYVSARFLPTKFLALFLIPGFILTYCGLFFVAMEELAGV